METGKCYSSGIPLPTSLRGWYTSTPSLTVTTIRRWGRRWYVWMTSPTQWTWVWVDSGSWWWTGRPGVLRFMGSQRVGHDWATKLNWTELTMKWWDCMPWSYLFECWVLSQLFCSLLSRFILRGCKKVNLEHRTCCLNKVLYHTLLDPVVYEAMTLTNS